MKTHGNLFERICSFENLLDAAGRAERGKRFQGNVGPFRSNLEARLLKLRAELLGGNYRPGPYRERVIEVPKRRMISAAPFRDRVVHHAVCNVVMPLFERKMVFDLYSNREGKGTHMAIRRCQEHCRRYPYVLKCDVRKFFPSMDHEVLKGILRRTIRCARTLELLDRIIDGSNAQEPVCTVFPGDDLAEAAERRVGLPIGNLTSQWFGCIYLSPFDHWVKEALGCPGYVRYVDDFLLFAEEKAALRGWRAAVGAELAGVRLRLNEKKSRAHRTRDGVTFLGQRVWPDRRRLCATNVRAARRRLRWNVRQYQRGEIDRDGLVRRWASWKGHAAQAEAEALIAQVGGELREALISGSRENEGTPAAGRRVEQQREQPAVRGSQQQQPVEHQQQHRVPVCAGASERGAFVREPLWESAAVHGPARRSGPKARPRPPVFRRTSGVAGNEYGRRPGAGSPQKGEGAGRPHCGARNPTPKEGGAHP